VNPYDNHDYWSLIRQIRTIDRAGGDSTLARLVTADWLEEQGEAERAEFIRTTAEDRGWYHDGSLGRLREFGIFKCLPDAVSDYEQTGGVTAGFLSVVRCTLAWWLAHGPTLCRRHPIRDIVITDKTPWPSGNVRGWWRIPIWTQPQWTLPADVFDRLADGQSHADGSRLYLSELEAVADLNAAAIRCAEAEADK